VFDYFDTPENERVLVRETVDILMPSIRPRSFVSLDTPAQHTALPPDFERYAKALAEALTALRQHTSGPCRHPIAAPNILRSGQRITLKLGGNPFQRFQPTR
jgi:hypothetical protein